MRPIFSVRRPAGRRAFRFSKALLACCLSALFLSPAEIFAQQQQQGVCAQVKIVIQQELTLERIGFDASLEVSNNDGTDPITDFSADLTFSNPLLSTNGVVDDSSSLFFVQAPTFESVNSVAGDGVIAPTTTARVHWFIIPKTTAGGMSPDGIRYMVGCRLAGKLRGVVIPPDVMVALPAQIYVKPEPQLEITYFQPRDVQGDDPFTPEVESPVPFTLGVLVKNSGYGVAHQLKIASQQPKIVENKLSLLIIAQLLGVRVNDSPLQSSSLTVNLGDIPPGQTRKGAWDMITSLSGEFIEFKASYTHASDLGGQETSDIKSLNAYFIVHEVLNDQPGRDNLKDFLADTGVDPELIPNALYESEGNVLPVNYLTNTAVVGSAGPGGSFQVTLTADKAGWGYLRMNDPGQAKLPIASVIRSDGKILNTNNYWTNIRYAPVTNAKSTYLNIFDLVGLNSYTYTVTYAQTTVDTTPPVTTMRFVGSVTQSGGTYYITPDTQIYFTAVDASPVSMFYSVTNGPFLPAVPFSLPAAGQYQIVFYATDSSNNREVNNTNIVVVSGSSALDFANVGTPGQAIFVAGDALSVRPFNAPITFQALADPSQVDAQVDVFQGVAAWATVSGVPSSPTANNSASLVVGGDYVDFYRYSLNGSAWSAETPVASPINLSSLTAGTYTVSVLGRSQYGSYLDSSNAVSVQWVVDPAAPATRVTGTPATPTRARVASLNIAGTGVTAYRWTINNDYYRPETNAPGLLSLPITSSTQQVVVVSVIGKTNGVYQPTNAPTTVSWNFDPLFAYNLPNLAKIRSVTITNIGATLQTFSWDGRNNGGTPMPPGWYMIRLTIQDQLGRTNSATRLVQISDISGSAAIVADVTRGAKNPYARGHWAVWEDQSDGNWQIYAQDLSAAANPIVKLTTGVLSQENPKTDGRYVVWQGRQANGNWDIYLKDLASVAAPQALTSTFGRDEINPAIDWPWVVYQGRPTADPTAPWQLTAYNLATAQSFPVSGSTQDELDPDVQAGRVVWQDYRDVGAGEIYLKNLETFEQRRMTTNTFGQYHPVIYGNWIAWQDTRNTEVDIYGFDLLRNAEVRITSTPENETRPYLEGSWLLCQEDSLGPLTSNVRLIHLPSLRAVPFTRSLTMKDRPALAAGKAVWLDTRTNLSSVLASDVPSLQAVFQNLNAVGVTDAMATYQQNAFNLLAAWHAQAGVQAITRYTSLTPQIVSETAYWTNGAVSGVNFPLTSGGFLWVRFNGQQVLDLGLNNNGAFNLAAGANVFSYAHYPSQYSAYRMLNQLGLANVRGIRMLDSESGLWVVAEVQNGQLVGRDFTIPNVAVLMLDMAAPVNNFKPQ
jgi:beta propeller repeat protein